MQELKEKKDKKQSFKQRKEHNCDTSYSRKTKKRKKKQFWFIFKCIKTESTFGRLCARVFILLSLFHNHNIFRLYSFSCLVSPFVYEFSFGCIVELKNLKSRYWKRFAAISSRLTRTVCFLCCSEPEQFLHNFYIRLVLSVHFVYIFLFYFMLLLLLLLFPFKTINTVWQKILRENKKDSQIFGYPLYAR